MTSKNTKRCVYAFSKVGFEPTALEVFGLRDGWLAAQRNAICFRTCLFLRHDAYKISAPIHSRIKKKPFVLMKDRFFSLIR